ncbi:MAG: hypothetical protein EOP22_12190 [Hyphomicrobiales bacterium]|nr:MAG: hypothetical protein EOP22_12190 [Hyphomicrobiales bacterium]
MRATPIFLMALVLALVAPPALAKSEKAAQPQAGAPGTPPGQAKADTPPPGQAKKDDDKPLPPGQAKKLEPPPPPAAASDPEAARLLVLTQEALPLARIVAAAEARTNGHVINARLVRLKDALLYQLTMLNDDGRSWRDYYDAATGEPVVLP